MDGFPEFPEPIAIDTERAWTATFDSWDQRKDDAFYRITLHEKAGARTFFALIPCNGTETDVQIRDMLHAIAKTGEPNTGYDGHVIRW